MTPWVLRLNDLTPQLAGRLPHTDTRLRPDVRCLELGIYDQVPFPYPWIITYTYLPLCSGGFF